MRTPERTERTAPDYTGSMYAALAAATSSPDPSTQNGAILTDVRGFGGVPAKSGAVSANNRPADGTFLREIEWADKPSKYALVEHAERNAIFTAARLGVPTECLL